MYVFSLMANYTYIQKRSKVNYNYYEIILNNLNYVLLCILYFNKTFYSINYNYYGIQFKLGPTPYIAF